MHPGVYKRPLFIGLAVFIVCLVCFYKPAPGPQDPSLYASSKEPVCVLGTVDGFAVSKKTFRNVILKVSSVNGAKTRGKLYARIENFEPQWKDEIRLCGKIKTPYGTDSPGNFNWRSYLAVKGVFAEISADGAQITRPAGWFYRAVRGVRADILHTFAENFNPNLAGIAGGVLLGERGGIDPLLYTAFQDSGAVHLLVASGGNVGFVTLMVFALGALCGFGRKRTAWLAVAAAGVYTLIAGADAPLTRAYFMTLCACMGYMWGRNSGVFQGLTVSCAVILAFHPAAVFETGFQMSFLATFAIIVCLNNYRPPYRWPGTVKFFARIFLATLSTQLILLPLFTNVFYKVSVTGLLSNMLLVPLASWVMGVACLFYICTLLKIGFLLKSVTFASLWLFERLVEFFAGFTLSSVGAAAWGAGTVAAYYCVLCWVFHLPLKNAARKTAPWLLGSACILLACQYVYARAVRVWMFNEWNNSAVIVRTCRGDTFLFGAGMKGDKLARAVLAAGARKIDAVFLTDTSAKAGKGLEELSLLLPVDKVVRPYAQGVWPGDRVQIGRTEVSAEWPAYAAQDEERVWREKGFSGKEDGISYRLHACGEELLIGAGQRFVQTPRRLKRPPRNGYLFWRV